MPRLFRTLLLSCFLGAFLSACSTNGSKTQEFSELELYNSAISAVESTNYLVAIEKLTQLEQRYPFGQFAEQTKLELIYSYYQSNDLENAQSASERFLRLHPEHPKVDYAYYMKGLTEFSQGQDAFDRILPIDQTRRDIGTARMSFNSFSELIQRFPNSEYVQDAQRRMVHLRNHLANYEVHVGNFYIQRKAYVAAANRGKYVIENFPSSSAVPDALVVMAKAYYLLDLDDFAEQAVTTLQTNFPQHPSLVDESLKKDSISHEEDTNWVRLLTFGLLG